MAEYGIYALASLMGAGYLMNNQKQQRGGKVSLPGNHNDETVGSNVYHSRDYYRHKETEYNKAKKHWDDAQNPMTTGIIPMYYNTLHVKQDAEKIPNSNFNNQLIYKAIEKLDNSVQSTIKSGIKNTPIHDSARNSKPEWGIVMDRPRDTTKDREGQDALSQIGGSLVPGQNDFTHNNMVPFYSGNITQDIRSENRAKEGKLELYTGQFKLNQTQKKECGLFFKPIVGLNNVYGWSGEGQHRDLSRYNPNNTGKKNNESPIGPAIQVGPGLNKGYTAEPSGGFNQTLRILPKTIEELRVDPVIETEGRTTSGASYIKKRGLRPQVYRNRPELLVENKNGERNFTTVGAVTGRTLRPNIMLRDTNRKKSRQLITHAKSIYNKERVAPKSRVSHRKNYYNTPFRNATSTSNKKVNDYGKSGYKARANNRQTTGKNCHLLAPTSVTKRPKVMPLDKARKTRKQALTHNKHTYTNSRPQRADQGPSYNPQEWAARTTIRETTENFDHLGFTGQVNGGVQPSYDPNTWVAKTTVKETTEDNGHLGWMAKLGAGKNKQYTLDPARTTIRETVNYDGYGIVGGIHKKHKAWNTQDRARTTIRETTENLDHYGGAVGPQKHKTYDPKDRARTTIKETTENQDHFGVAVGPNKHKTYDPNDRARTTIRETTENLDHYGGAVGVKKHKAWNTNERARTTIRETTENLDHYGGAAGPQKHKTYDPNDRARTTIRETTENLDHFGGASGVIIKKHKAWNTNEKARTTIRETTEDNNHLGNVTANSVKKGGGYSTTNWQAKNTNRQFTSDNNYTGAANSNNKKIKSYDDAYNARLNINKEKISKGRRPGGSGPVLGHKNINVETKKMDEDRINGYARVKESTTGNIYNENAVQFTSERNHLPQHDIRLDTTLLEPYKRNPLTHSLASYY